ncbi:MAG: VOC family protein [Vicinamibacterales bacterium]
MPVSPIPEGFKGPVPYVVVSNGAAAIDFYTKAFGATERTRMPGPGGAIMHADLEIAGGRLMLSEEMQGSKSPASLGGTPVSLFIYVRDVDAAFAKAIAAGATAKAPLADMFWGDRWGILTDPFGHEWQLATHVEDVAPDEMQRRMAAMSR